MRRIRSIILTMMLILTTTLFSRVPVLAAANISVSVNKSNVKVGDTVTVTLSITSGYGAQGILQKSSGVLGGSSDEYFTIGAGVGDVKSFSYKATSVGTCTFSIPRLDDTTDAGGGTPSIGVGSATVNVTSPSSNNDSNSNKDNKDNSGSTSTYNIVVTRRAEDDPENADKQDNWKKFDINGTEWTMVNDIPEDVVPEGFEHSKTVIDGLEYNTLHGTFGDITLVYLQSESGNGLFVYDAAQNTAYEFVRINSESHFIVVLLPKVDDVPEGYNEISLSIEGQGCGNSLPDQSRKNR